MVKCQLEFIIVHYFFSYYTHAQTHSVRTHTDNESQSARSRTLSVCLPLSLSLARAL